MLACGSEASAALKFIAKSKVRLVTYNYVPAFHHVAMSYQVKSKKLPPYRIRANPNATYPTNPTKPY